MKEYTNANGVDIYIAAVLKVIETDSTIRLANIQNQICYSIYWPCWNNAK